MTQLNTFSSFPFCSIFFSFAFSPVYNVFVRVGFLRPEHCREEQRPLRCTYVMVHAFVSQAIWLSVVGGLLHIAPNSKAESPYCRTMCAQVNGFHYRRFGIIEFAQLHAPLAFISPRQRSNGNPNPFKLTRHSNVSASMRCNRRTKYEDGNGKSF